MCACGCERGEPTRPGHRAAAAHSSGAQPRLRGAAAPLPRQDLPPVLRTAARAGLGRGRGPGQRGSDLAGARSVRRAGGAVELDLHHHPQPLPDGAGATQDARVVRRVRRVARVPRPGRSGGGAAVGWAPGAAARADRAAAGTVAPRAAALLLRGALGDGGGAHARRPGGHDQDGAVSGTRGPCRDAAAPGIG